MEEKFNINQQIEALRPDMGQEELTDEHLLADPFILFEAWLQTAIRGGDPYANAMTLCTAGADHLPDARIVLLRNLSYRGFTFYTNYNSKKAIDLTSNPHACLLFFWKAQARQVKVQGAVSFLPGSESDAYFASRPFESQVGAWASAQSEMIASRKELDLRFERELKKHAHQPVPRPAHWGGYVLLPSAFEFWQGRSSRLHDRVCFKQNGRAWIKERLMP